MQDFRTGSEILLAMLYDRLGQLLAMATHI
jgi:hypothetical protein